MDETVVSEKQQQQNASTAVNGVRQVARFNVSAPFRVSASPLRDVAEATKTDAEIEVVVEAEAELLSPNPPRGQRERRSVSPSRFNVEFVDEQQTPHHCDDGTRLLPML